MGALSTTWDEHYRGPFQPLVPGVSFASADDVNSLEALVDAQTAAIIVEPIQGEGGVRPIPPAMVQAIASACRRTGALLIADEVQSGSGRTGEFLYSKTIGLRPDLVSLGKALGAGVPIGATLVSKDIATTLSPGDHGTTYGGNLLACRAALVFLDALDGGLQDHVRDVATHLGASLHRIAARHAGQVKAVRGAGLLAGLELTRDAQPVVTAALDRGLLINRTATNVVRLLPPYVVTAAEIDEAMGILDDVVGA
jgi:acetylornithine/succinyldiaminopimelate/putrescine aminotransferase